MRYLIFFIALSANAQSIESPPNDFSVFRAGGGIEVLTPIPFTNQSELSGYHIEQYTTEDIHSPRYDQFIEPALPFDSTYGTFDE